MPTLTNIGYHVHGRRWFQRSYGNTYNSVTIYKGGEQVAYLPRTYGYGDYWLQRAHEWMGEHAFPELKDRHENGAPKHNTTSYFRDHGISYSVDDVARERDL